jgi:hypothetical protein
MVQCWPRPVDYSVVRRCHTVTTECLHSDERYVNEELINDETSVGGLIDLLPPDGTEPAAQTGNLPISPVRWAIELASPEMSARESIPSCRRPVTRTESPLPYARHSQREVNCEVNQPACQETVHFSPPYERVWWRGGLVVSRASDWRRDGAQAERTACRGRPCLDHIDGWRLGAGTERRPVRLRPAGRFGGWSFGWLSIRRRTRISKSSGFGRWYVGEGFTRRGGGPLPGRW